MSERIINTHEELRGLSRGAVIVSPNWTDAFGYAGDGASPTKLLNVATGCYTSPAELGNFYPAKVIYEFAWAKGAPRR